MSTLLHMELEGLPPTVNHLYLQRGGRRYKSPDGRAYQEQVCADMRRQWGQAPYSGHTELRITYLTRDKRRWDIDNRVKALQDCLVLAGVLKDDSQIRRLVVERTDSDVTATYLSLSKYVRVNRSGAEHTQQRAKYSCMA